MRRALRRLWIGLRLRLLLLALLAMPAVACRGQAPRSADDALTQAATGYALAVRALAAADAVTSPLAPPCYYSPVITDTTGTGMAVAEAVIPPGFDWGTYFEPMLVWLATPGGTNPAGSIFQWADLPWIESDGPCLVHHSHAISGGHWAYWLDDDFAPAARWTALNGLYGPDQILWSSSGVNSWSLSVAQNVANLTAVIARFRAANPDGPVVLDTQYPSQYTAGVPASWAEAIYQVAAVTEGCLVVDTNARHDFEWWFAQGLIADGIHASDAGVAQYMTDLGEIIDAIAGDDSTMTHKDTLRTGFANLVLAAIDGGAGAGKLVIRDGETVVATVTLGDPSGTVSGPTLSFAGFPRSDLACDNAGTPDNAIVTDSDDTVILTLTAGIADAEVLLAKATYAADEPLKITSATYEAPP